MDITSTSSKNIPKMSSPKLEIKNNHYVVKVGLLYNYYPIKVSYREDSPIMHFEKTPPVLMEGVAVVNKKAYHVTTKDLQRLIVRKSREVVAEAKREKVNGNNAETGSTGSVHETVQYSNKPGVSGEASMEILETADNAWQEQIGTLLNLISSKEGEEWVISDSAQS